MRTYYKQIIILFLLGNLLPKKMFTKCRSYRKGMEGYTSYQKKKRYLFVIFCLRRLLRSLPYKCIQVLYKFSDDDIVSVLNYYIGRCYEEMMNYKLANIYYQKVIKKDPKDSQSYKAFLQERLC